MPDMWLDVDTALSEVPVNLLPLLDDTDFKTRETGIVYNQAGMDLVWNFVTSAGAMTQTVVTPTTGGDYDWAHQGDGIYSIEIPASGGASINNDTEGYGWFTGFCTGVLPWRGPTIGFRAAAINDALCDGGDLLAVDITQINGATTPVTNLEDDYDGTGYDKSASAIGEATALGAGAVSAAAVATGAIDADAIADNAIDAGAIATDAIGAAELAADAVAEIADAVWDEDIVAAHNTADTAGELLDTDLADILADTNELQTDDVPGLIAALNDPTAAAVRTEMDSNSTQLAAIVADTNELQTDDVPGLIAALNDLSAAQVNAEMDTALADVNLDHVVGTAAGIPAVPAGTYLDQVMDDGTATFDRTTDSLQALRDRGDAAWVTGGGGAITQILNVQPLIPESIDLANTATWRLAMMLINSVDDLPTTAEITPGTIDIDRKAKGGTSWSSVVSGAACSELAGLIYYDEVFDSGTGYAEGDSIRITLKSQSITADANTHEVSDANGRVFYTEIRETLNDPTAAAIRTEIDSNSTQLAAIVADTNELQTDDVPGLIAALNDPTAAAVRTEIDSNSTQLAAIVADTNELQTDDVPGLIAALNDPTAAAIADAVWDEASTGHVDAGKAGAQLWTDVDAILADTSELQTDDVPGLISALNDPTAAAIADAVWDEASTGHVDAGKAGAQLWTDIDAILADTSELQTDDVPGLIAALNDLSAAAVNAEVDDVMSTDTQSLPGQAAPSATPTLAVAIMYLYKAFRNKIDQDATILQLYADDGSTVDQKATVSDDGSTYTRGEIGSGP